MDKSEISLKSLLFMKGQSERVPGKNLRDFNGKPLFHWILETLSKINFIDEIIINTDSEEIANSAKSHFKVTIHERPNYLLNIQKNEPNQIMDYDLTKVKGDFFLQTHATNPLLSKKTIINAILTFFKNYPKYDSLFSVTDIQTRLYDNSFNPLNHNPRNLIKTQELPVVYEENSCLYIFSRDSFNKNKNRIGSKPYLYSIKSNEAADIDTEIEFQIAEIMMDLKNRK
tara:strand:+ start:447 stop:1130 length:684 start_codon:yes stop_codon:yes gene_type:complete